MTDESPRIPPCDLCGHAQVEYGAVLVGPPREDGYAKKWHVCVSCYELIAPAAGTLSKSGPVSPSDRVPCTLENCGHMRQLRRDRGLPRDAARGRLGLGLAPRGAHLGGQARRVDR